MPTPNEILDLALQQAINSKNQRIIRQDDITKKVEYVCRVINNRAGARLLLACTLAKTYRPEVDIRKPYTEIGDSDTYSGRYYDENYITQFITENRLPCNHTTAFLTPALRNRNIVLTPDVNLVGRPAALYQTVLALLNHVHQGDITAQQLLIETIRYLLLVRDEQQQRIDSLLLSLETSDTTIPLATEEIIRLVNQHLEQPRSSRLPVLVIAAIYQTIETNLGEKILPLASHNAADSQTQAMGDIEIALLDDDHVVTSYEVKTRKVTTQDIDLALQKISQHMQTLHINNYIFITTQAIDEHVADYAAQMYEKTNGIEIAILDCVSFLRYFLHLFSRFRGQFLQNYQDLVLNESDSAVSQPLKEVFLALRQAAENRE